MAAERVGRAQRQTRETSVEVALKLDGGGRFSGASGLGFFDHLLAALARHGGLDLTVQCQGDLEVDGHHTVEDCGICLGRALRQALGEGWGLNRFGQALLPMDEALVLAAVDISGRGFLAYRLDPGSARLGDFDPQLAEEFWRAVVYEAGITLHLRALAGKNAHHLLEASFKGVARALRQAVAVTDPTGGVPSTKGSLLT